MKYVRFVTAAVALAMMVALIIEPARYALSVTNGLAMYVMSVLPSMLPFFFLSGLLTGTGVAGKLSRLRVAETLFHAPREGFYVMVLGMLSGYPVGAKLTAELYEGGMVSAAGAKKMVAFTSATGPMFVVGAVGTQILGDYRAGLAMLTAHYLATIANGLLYRGRKRTCGGENAVTYAVRMDRLLWETAYNTVQSLLIAAVYIVMFNMVADMLEGAGLFALAGRAFAHLGMSAETGVSLLYGLTEMTRGCVLLAEASLPIAEVAPLSCMLVTFGGLSVCVQSAAYLTKCHVNPLYFLLTKITQAALAYGFCRLICLLL